MGVDKMNIEDLSEESLIHVLKFLDWRHLQKVSSVSALFERLCEDVSLHKDSVIEVDVSETYTIVDCLRYIFKLRNIKKIVISDTHTLTKKNPIAFSPKVTELLGFFSPIADNVLKLEVQATVSEGCLGVLQIFQNLQKLSVQNYFPIFDELYDNKLHKACLGYADYCRLRDSWSLEDLRCLHLSGRSWTLMGSLLRKTNNRQFRKLCCYHTDKGDLRVMSCRDGVERNSCGGCSVCVESDKIRGSNCY